MTIKSTETRFSAGYVLYFALLTVTELTNPTLLHGLHLSLCSANCHKIDINPTSLQGVAKKDNIAAAM